MPRLILLILLILGSLASYSQDLSYYSRFGFGDAQTGVFANNAALGGIAGGYQDVFHINMVNPASYAKASYTILSTGLAVGNRRLVSNNTELSAGDASLDYMAIQFPIYKTKVYNDDLELIKETPKLGLSIGLLPYFQSNYRQDVSLTLDDSTSFSKLYDRSGRLYRVYLGLGGEVFSNKNNSLRFGANFNYIFGEISQGEVVNFSEDISSFNTRTRSFFRVSDAAYDIGVQFRRDIGNSTIDKNGARKRDLYLIAGAYAHLPFNIKASITTVTDRFRLINGSVSNVDTFSNTAQEGLQVRFPSTYGGGVTLTKENYLKDQHWLVGFDVAYTTWANTDQPLGNSTTLNNSLRASVGVEFTPNTSPFAGFFKRTTYRFGGYYDNGHLEVFGNRIREFGTSFGLSFMVIDRQYKIPVTKINLSLQVGQTGTTASDLYQETFFKVNLGLDLYGNWFVKRKYN